MAVEGRTALGNLVGDMTVLVQGERGRSMAEVALDRLNIIPGPDGSQKLFQAKHG